MLAQPLSPSDGWSYFRRTHDLLPQLTGRVFVQPRSRLRSADLGNSTTRGQALLLTQQPWELTTLLLTSLVSGAKLPARLLNMALSEASDAAARHVQKDDFIPARTALPSRPVSSKADNHSLRTRSPPPTEDGSQHGTTPSPLRPRHFDRSPSITHAQTSHPISPVSAHELPPSDSMTDVPTNGTLPPQTGQVCR